jgi:hypothetical protein
MNIFNIFKRSETKPIKFGNSKPREDKPIDPRDKQYVEFFLKLKEIKKILFPPLELHDDLNENGKLVKYHIDYCIDSNLETVLNDLQDGYNDSKCYDTLNSVIKRLIHIRKLLDVETNMDKDAEYIVVKNLDTEQNIEDIR